MNKVIIHLICPDQKGIIAELTSTLYNANANILSIEQHVDNKDKKFYIRILSDLSALKIKFDDLKNDLCLINSKLKGEINFFDPNTKINAAILGTTESGPIYELLIKNKSGDLNCAFPIIISNHEKLKYISEQFNIKYAKIDDNTKLLSILEKNNIELIILARYMQIIPKTIIDRFKNKIINIHHGFLPAFKGANPYKQAAEKGVKLIGATAHYATEALDEGPIIHQDVVRVSHTDTENKMRDLGKEIERSVLHKAVKAHLDYKIITYDNKTIVFK